MKTNPPKYKIGSDEELSALWGDLMGPGGFGRRSLWMIFLDEQSQTLPLVFPLEDLPLEPDQLLVTNLSTVLADVLDTTPAVSTSFLLSRPGPDAITDSDRRWTRALLHAIAPPARRGPIHLATTGRIRVIAADDLLGASLRSRRSRESPSRPAARSV